MLNGTAGTRSCRSLGCEVSRQDAGCEQFEVFQSVSDPGKLVLLELWKDQAALDAHAKLQAQRPALPGWQPEPNQIIYRANILIAETGDKAQQALAQ